MERFLAGLRRRLARLWLDVSFATANGAVDAVRYQPRRLLLTGGHRLAPLPGDLTPSALGVSRRLDRLTDVLARRIGTRFGAGAEAFARWLAGAFGGVIDHAGASAIDDLTFGDRLGPGILKPHPHAVAVLVLDMRGFSKLTVNLDDSRYLTDRIGDYLTAMTRVIEQHRGVVFDYTGDGLLAVFLPELTGKKEHEMVEDLAGPVTNELHARFEDLRIRWEREWQESGRLGAEIGLGVGITLGQATIGIMGPTGKEFFGVVGPPVNLAAYLCSQAYPGTALVDEESFVRSGAALPDGHRIVRLKSEKLHQRIRTVRIRPQAAA